MTLLTGTQRVSCCHVDLAWVTLAAVPPADLHLITWELPLSRHIGWWWGRDRCEEAGGGVCAGGR